MVLYVRMVVPPTIAHKSRVAAPDGASKQLALVCTNINHATRGGREGERNIICGPLMDVRGKWGEEGERGSRGRDSIHRGNQPAAVFAIGVSRYGGDGRWRFLPLPWFLALFYPS